MSQMNGKKQYITIEEVFGEDKKLTYMELVKRGATLNLTKMNIDLLLQSAQDYGAVKQLGIEDNYAFEFDPLPYCFCPFVLKIF